MKMTKLTSSLVCVIALLLSVRLMAAEMPAQDAAGSKDDPLLSRYPGSVITGYSKKPFDESDLIAGPYKKVAGTLPFEKAIHVEGALTLISYVFPVGRSSLDVMRNYTDALRKANMSIVYSCDKSACGADPNDPSTYNFSRSFPGAKIPSELMFNFFDGDNQSRYVLAKASSADGSVTYIAVYVSPATDLNGAIFLEIARVAPLQTGQVSVNLSADDMAKSIGTEGRVALYGLQFDTDKTDLRADSKPSLIEIAKLLDQNSKLTVYVVGHTDNQGSFAHNLELSQKRSEAIVQALVNQFKIAPARLTPKGVASLAPIASNDSEAGRAKNRRVELVKQ